MKKATSRAKLKILQLEVWLEPARLGLITTKYSRNEKKKIYIHTLLTLTSLIIGHYYINRPSISALFSIEIIIEVSMSVLYRIIITYLKNGSYIIHIRAEKVYNNCSPEGRNIKGQRISKGIFHKN